MDNSKILGIELYMDKNKEEMVDYIHRKITEKKGKEVKPTGEIFDRLVNQLVREFPFGQGTDMTHIVLSNALISSLWCGWLSQAMVNRKEEKFSPDYLDKFGRAITKAYDIGREYARERR
jgi:hypothetical protein